MKQILVAIKNDFVRETYSEVFRDEGFEVLETKSGNEALRLLKEEIPDIVISDINLPEVNGFDLLKVVKEKTSTKLTPVIIFAQLEKKDDRLKAMELEAKDFITAAGVTPAEVVRKVKIALGEQRSYQISIMKNLSDARQLISDLGYTYDFKCPVCGADLMLDLIRDLSKGEKNFIVSVVCPDCGK